MDISHDFEADKKLASRDPAGFFAEMLGELSQVLQEAVGHDDAEGFTTIIAARMGNRISAEYSASQGAAGLSVEALAAAMVHLKSKLEGGFSIVSVDDEKIVLRNSACPFGKHVVGRPSLCAMTSNVFGRMAADSNGYAAVDLKKTIARGDAECLVTVHLQPQNISHHMREYISRDDTDV